MVVFKGVSFLNIPILSWVLWAEHLIEETSHEQTELIEEGVEVDPKVVTITIICKALLHCPQSVSGDAVF